MGAISRAVALSVFVSLVGMSISQAGAQSNSNQKCKFDAGPSMTAVWSDPVLGNSGEHDPGDYEHRLDADFGYLDCGGDRHVAPTGFVFNGASIPQALWSIGYTPLSGKVLGPAVIHDFLCEKVAFTSDRVHRLFREGLLSTGTPSIDAAIMYAAVKHFGPQWASSGGKVTRPKWHQGLWDLIVQAIRSASDIFISNLGFKSAHPAFSDVKRIELKPGSLDINDAEQIDDFLRKIDRLPDDVLEDLRRGSPSFKIDPQGRLGPVN